ncbi:uncharacterized protein ARMOST_20936 [Armillaria ostoyae]|uniref:Uncharacterized protein n=1 Tax=Armillaria ostoyae TaxID=47428 RepID=A0A284S8U8_ARMOS|nr:uncharacterized protein ARMOST_20936 [Armillaria ostoyae]
MVTEHFRDPTIKVMHECKMFEVCMGKNPAAQFFYELEKEAKLAGRHLNEGEHGTMVKAVRLRLPNSYTNIIANIRQDIPLMYPKWKACILVMYDERQKKYAFDQSIQGIR